MICLSIAALILLVLMVSAVVSSTVHNLSDRLPLLLMADQSGSPTSGPVPVSIGRLHPRPVLTKDRAITEGGQV
jgi:hypothetical protein